MMLVVYVILRVCRFIFIQGTLTQTVWLIGL